MTSLPLPAAAERTPVTHAAPAGTAERGGDRSSGGGRAGAVGFGEDLRVRVWEPPCDGGLRCWKGGYEPNRAEGEQRVGSSWSGWAGIYETPGWTRRTTCALCARHVALVRQTLER